MLSRLLAYCLLCLTLLAACGGEEVAPSALASEADSVAAATTAMPSPSPQPTVTPTPTPLQPRWKAMDLGVPAGDVYLLHSLAVDATEGLLYVLGGRTPEDTPGLSVVDLADGSVLRRIPLAIDQPGSFSGKLAVTGDIAWAYLLDRRANVLYSLHLNTGTLTPRAENVQDFALTPAGEVVLQHRERIVRANAGLTEELAVFPGQPGSHFAVNGEEILISRWRDGKTDLTVYSLTDGSEKTATTIPGRVDHLASGPRGTWYVAARNDGQPLLQQFDVDLEPVAEVEGLNSEALFYDAARRRLLVAGYWQGRNGDDATYTLAAFAADGLALLVERTWPDWRIPNVFAATRDQIIGIRAFDDRDAVYFLAPDDLTLTAVTATGVRLQKIVADGTHNRLFVADNQDRILRIDLSSGAIAAVWEGSTPLALDRVNGRLYANRGRGQGQHVVALDADSGALLAEYPQPGVPAPDPQRDLVYIAHRGVAIYDRTGAELGRLASTFPDSSGFVPNPSAFSAVVEPVHGGLIVFKNNGVPGSNNRNFAVFFPPPGDGAELPADEPVEIPLLDDALVTIAFDEQNGDFYLAYDSFRNITGLQHLRPDGTVADTLWGRAGWLAYDSRRRWLYVQKGRTFARLAPDLGEQSYFTAPGEWGRVVFDSATGQFYFQEGAAPVLRHARPEALMPFRAAPGPAQTALPDGRAVSLVLVEEAESGRTVAFVTVAGQLFRTTDGGATWQPLLLASAGYAPSMFLAASDGSLYVTANGPDGADGVLRSDDGGETWRTQNEGLVDLRSNRPLLPGNRGRLYLATVSRHLQRWDGEEQRWSLVALPEDRPFDGTLQAAPDGTLYYHPFGPLYVSDDDGDTWQALPPVDELLRWQIGPDFATTRRLYALRNYDAPRFIRSDDGGQSWREGAPGIRFPDTSSFYLGLRAAGDTLYVTETDNDGLVQVYRSRDGGDHWERLADPEPVRGAEAWTFDRAGRFWFVRGGRLETITLQTLVWQTVQTLPTPTPTPTATPPPPPTPTPIACELPLDDGQSRLQQQFPGLLCPTGERASVFAARQPFQNGLMIWRSDNRTIYVLSNDGRWQSFPDTWDESQPESDPALIAPAGLVQPIRGFGKVWREQLGGPDAAIGWGTTTESGANVAIQAWQGGQVFTFHRSEEYILLHNGLWGRTQ